MITVCAPCANDKHGQCRACPNCNPGTAAVCDCCFPSVARQAEEVLRDA